MKQPNELGALEMRQSFLARELSPVEVLDAVAARIEATARFNSFVTTTLDQARSEAREAERAYAAGEGGERPLLGVPVAVKDLIDTAGVRTTYGSPIFREHVPARDAHCVTCLREAGAVIVGKTSLFEFAWGVTSTNAAYGDCLNPCDPERSAGGSSGGSAAALALRQVPLALGTDTAGSIRIPAAFCGVMGLKPSFGRVATRGTFPLAPSLDTVGPMARRADDLALAMRALTAGEWPQDGVDGMRVAVWAGPAGPEPDEGTRVALAAAADELAVQGCAVEPVAELELRGALETFATVQLVEALAAHSERGLYPDRRAHYLPAIANRLERAGAIAPELHAAAVTARGVFAAGLRELLARFDVMLSPVAPIGAPRLGDERSVRSGAATGLREVVLPYTVPQSLAGLPACALPAGTGADGLPRAVQLTGRRGEDATVLAAASALTSSL